MFNTLEELSESRTKDIIGLKHLTTSGDSKDFSGFINFLSNMYPDEAHFIYELLQNAEDKKAENVFFKLTNDFLIFEHDGGRIDSKCLFSLNDIESITGLGISTKKENTSIGKFGVGFKAVFSYTDTPRIFSGDFAFEIHDMFIPCPVEMDKSLQKGITRFVFPFNSKLKSKETAFNEISLGLKNIKDNTLLFLKNISSIKYELPNGEMDEYLRINESNNILTLLGHKKNTKWLRFEKIVSIYDEESKNNKDCSIGIAFLLSKDNKYNKEEIIPCNGGVSIFFPAEKEVSNFKFILNAPFASTIGRDSVRLCHSNKLIIEQLAILMTEALEKINKYGYMDIKFLKVMPKEIDNIPELYKPIFDAIIESYLEKPYFPTKDNKLTYLKNLKKTRSVISDLISTDDLKMLLNNSQLEWVKNSLENSEEDRFIKQFTINELKLEDFIIYNEGTLFEEYIKNREDKWLYKFYETLDDEYDSYNDYYDEYNIFKLRDGTFTSSYKCYYFNDDVKDINKQINIISKFVYTKDKKINEKILAFFRKIGIIEFNEQKEIETILEKYISSDYSISTEDHIKDIKAILNFYKKRNPYDILPNKFYYYKYILNNDDYFSNATSLYLSIPYEKTFYSLLEDVDKKTKRLKLNKVYKKHLNDEELVTFINFLKDIRINHLLPIKSCGKDYIFENLESILKYKNYEISLYIWNYFSNMQFYSYESYKKNKSEYYTNMTYILRTSDWVPDNNGKYRKFHKPSEISDSELPKQFLRTNNGFTDAIGFGEKDIELKKNDEFAQSLGYKDTADLKRNADRNKLIEEFGLTDEVDKLIEKKKKSLLLDDPDIKNRDRRAEINKLQINEANKKEYSMKEISQRTSNKSLNQRNFLMSQYYDSINEILCCQLCDNNMPFKKRDGKWYFEAVEMFSKEFIDIEDQSFYLCLCPVCSARYREYVKTNDRLQNDIMQKIISSETPQIISLILDKNSNLFFKKKHWFDLNIKLNELSKKGFSEE